MIPLSYHNCIFLFSLSKLSCHKLQEKIIMKLVIIPSLNTNHQSGWTLILILLIAIYFLTATNIFFISQGRYYYFVKATHVKFSPFPPAIFPLNNLCEVITALKKSSKYQQNTTKRLQEVQNINTHKLLVKQIQTDTTDQNKNFQI